MVITRVAPFSAARIVGVINAVFGLIVGGMFSLIGFAGAFANTNEGAGVFGALFGAAAIVLLPIFYGVVGFVSALVGSLIFNAAAGLVGGVEIEVQ
jgi:hypothetical protein